MVGPGWGAFVLIAALGGWLAVHNPSIAEPPGSPKDAPQLLAQVDEDRCWTEKVCQKGSITDVEQCCSKGDICNFWNEPFKDCGDDACVEGEKVKCPAEPSAKEKKACALKKGKKTPFGEFHWRVICDSATSKLVRACAGDGSYPTNYEADYPPMFADFVSCGADACVPGRDEKRCAELKPKKPGRDGHWHKQCVNGKISKRWHDFKGRAVKCNYGRLGLTECGEGTCVPGRNAKCP
jgi:hypothetical protein